MMMHPLFAWPSCGGLGVVVIDDSEVFYGG